MLSATVKAYRPTGVSASPAGRRSGRPHHRSCITGGDTNHKGQIAPEVRRNSTHLTEPYTIKGLRPTSPDPRNPDECGKMVVRTAGIAPYGTGGIHSGVRFDRFRLGFWAGIGWLGGRFSHFAPRQR